MNEWTEILKFPRYGLVGIMCLLIILAGYGVYQTSVVGLACAAAHHESALINKETNIVLRDLAVALVKLENHL